MSGGIPRLGISNPDSVLTINESNDPYATTDITGKALPLSDAERIKRQRALLARNNPDTYGAAPTPDAVDAVLKTSSSAQLSRFRRRGASQLSGDQLPDDYFGV